MRRAFLVLATAAISVLITLLLGEVMLRAAGRAPREIAGDGDSPRSTFVPDPVLGWRNGEARMGLAERWPDARAGRLTLLADGRRSTGDEPRPPGGEVVVVGCSVSFGHGLSDEETWPWLLQRELPERRVLNYATGGYGTYQSLLMLERVLPTLDSPALVLYGFIAHHERRNTADPRWLRDQDDPVRTGKPTLPWVSLDDAGNLVRHPPAEHLGLPLRSRLALAAFLEDLRDEGVSAGRDAYAADATLSLLHDMNALARAHGAAFGIVVLRASPGKSERYLRAAESDGALPIACVVPAGPEWAIPDDGHPNAKANAQIARCVFDAVRDRLGEAR